MSDINYKPMVFRKLEELKEVTGEFSFGEVLYCFLRKPMLNQKPIDVDISWIREIKDRDFYTALEKAKKSEEI